jgi:lipoprotein-anchoring transpeptidase ErfK/SrfK
MTALHSLARSGRLALAVVLLPLLAACGTPAQADTDTGTAIAADELYLVVSVSERVVRVFRGEEQIRSYPIAVGKEDHETPTGEFRIHQIDWNPDWTPPDSEWAEGFEPTEPGASDNPMGRVRMIYQRPYSLHGTENVESLGQAASHGSIRVANDDIIALARLVMEAGGESRSEGWFERVLGDPTTMHEVPLSDPVRLINVD